MQKGFWLVLFCCYKMFQPIWPMNVIFLPDTGVVSRIPQFRRIDPENIWVNNRHVKPKAVHMTRKIKHNKKWHISLNKYFIKSTITLKSYTIWWGSSAAPAIPITQTLTVWYSSPHQFPLPGRHVILFHIWSFPVHVYIGLNTVCSLNLCLMIWIRNVKIYLRFRGSTP